MLLLFADFYRYIFFSLIPMSFFTFIHAMNWHNSNKLSVSDGAAAETILPGNELKINTTKGAKKNGCVYMWMIERKVNAYSSGSYPMLRVLVTFFLVWVKFHRKKLNHLEENYFACDFSVPLIWLSWNTFIKANKQ